MQVRLKREHLNIARFEPDYGLDPMLDLTLVGAERQYRIHRRASNWQDFIEQDTLSPIEVDDTALCHLVFTHEINQLLIYKHSQWQHNNFTHLTINKRMKYHNCMSHFIFFFFYQFTN